MQKINVAKKLTVNVNKKVVDKSSFKKSCAFLVGIART